MSSDDLSGPDAPAPPGPAVTGETPISRWRKFRLVVKVVELRLRFIALMAVTGLTFAYWDTIWNRYDKWMRPPASAHAHADGDGHASVAGTEFFCPMHP